MSLHQLEQASKQLSKFVCLFNHCSLYTEAQHSEIPVVTFILKRNTDVQDPKNRAGYRKYYVKQKSYQISP